MTTRMNKVAFQSVVRRPRAVGRLPPKAWVAFYWRFLEFGTNTRSNARGANRSSTPISSWIRPALAQASGGALTALQKLFMEMTAEEIAKLPPTIPSGGH